MRILMTILLTTLMTTFAYANTIWYDPVSKRQIVATDEKTKSDMTSKEGISDQITSVKLKECESYSIVNNAIQVKDYCKESKDMAKAKEDAKKIKEAQVKLKLNLSNQEWEDLKQALGL